MSLQTRVATQTKTRRSGKLTFAIAGAGGRGHGFAEWLRDNVGVGSVVAVADPRASARKAVAEMHGIGEDLQFETWQEMLSRPQLADVLVNSTMDSEHAESACRA